MEYEEFLRDLEPMQVGLDSTSCSINRPLYWGKEPKRRVLSSSYAVKNVGDRHFDVEGSYSVSIQLDKEDGPIAHAVKIDCVFSAHFHTSARADEHHAQRFAAEEVWLMLWPFFRQFISDTTARMSIPPIIVPLALTAGDFTKELPQPQEPKKGIAKRATRKKA